MAAGGIVFEGHSGGTALRRSPPIIPSSINDPCTNAASRASGCHLPNDVAILSSYRSDRVVFPLLLEVTAFHLQGVDMQVRYEDATMLLLLRRISLAIAYVCYRTTPTICTWALDFFAGHNHRTASIARTSRLPTGTTTAGSDLSDRNR